MFSRIIIVSNRLPITIFSEGGNLTAQRSIGGLATALNPLLEQYETMWIGWTGLRRSLKPTELRQLQLPDNLLPVDLSASLVRRYYDRAANGTIWPSLLHFVPANPCSDRDWQGLIEVTKRFARKIQEVCRPEDVIWIHDYHFMLLPQMLREAGVRNRIGFFLHTPFPNVRFLRQLPHHRAILNSLAEVDVLGLQTKRDVVRFKSAFREINPFSTLNARVQEFPIGIDYDLYYGAAGLPEVNTRISEASGLTTGKRVIFSLSRLDYVKGITTQLEAFEKLLEGMSPSEREKIVYKLGVAPSRESIREYRSLKSDIQKTVARINKRFGTANLQPVDYSYQTFDFHDVVAWYQMADVCLVAPRADGMNLIAKEYIASRQDDKGMLVLSHSIGAAFQLKSAVLVDPLDVSSVARGLATALDMPNAEKELRSAAMRRAVREEDIFWWTDRFLQSLAESGIAIPSTEQLIDKTELSYLITKT